MHKTRCLFPPLSMNSPLTLPTEMKQTVNTNCYKAKLEYVVQNREHSVFWGRYLLFLLHTKSGQWINMCPREAFVPGNWVSDRTHSSVWPQAERPPSLPITFFTSSRMAVSFPVSEPTNSSSCSTVSAAEFLKAGTQKKCAVVPRVTHTCSHMLPAARMFKHAALHTCYIALYMAGN